jgi:hypothetical protein
MSNENGRKGKLTQEQRNVLSLHRSVLPEIPFDLRELLESHFEPADIREYGELPDGRKLSSIAPDAIIRRLTDCFGGTWSFEVLNHNVYHEAFQVVATVRISHEFWSKSPSGSDSLIRVQKEAIGNSVIKTVQGQVNHFHPNYPVYFNLGWDIKSAVTDGMKKAASMFGVGLHIFERDGNVAAPTQQQLQGQPVTHTQPALGFQVDKINKFFNSLGFPIEQWTQWFGITDATTIPMELANAILSGQHPIMQDFRSKTGKNINEGLKGSEAR